MLWCCIISAAMSSKIDSSAKYLKTHEWARVDGDAVVFGISDHAQEAMSDLVYVELPKVGQTLKAGETFGVVESVKAASDVYAPISGEVIAVNDALPGAPETLNQEPYAAGWMVKIKPANPAELDVLMDAAAYEQFLKEEEH
jgi:glycine cleavage system H protein